MENQKRLEEHLEKCIRENNVDQKDILNGMMRSTAAGCSYSNGTMSIAFPVQDWQANRVGKIHGGIIASAFDITLAGLARFYAGENFSPTMSMEVKYHRPAEVGDSIIVTAKKLTAGKRIINLSGECVSATTGKLIATATATFMSIDTDKEHR